MRRLHLAGLRPADRGGRRRSGSELLLRPELRSLTLGRLRGSELRGLAKLWRLSAVLLKLVARGSLRRSPELRSLTELGRLSPELRLLAHGSLRRSPELRSLTKLRRLSPELRLLAHGSLRRSPELRGLTSELLELIAARGSLGRELVGCRRHRRRRERFFFKDSHHEIILAAFALSGFAYVFIGHVVDFAAVVASGLDFHKVSLKMAY